MNLFLNKAVEENVNKTLKKAGLVDGKPLVGIHPSSGGGNRTWTESAYSELIKSLVNMNYQVLVTGSKSELYKVNEIIKLSGVPVINTVDKTNLDELKTVISKCSVFCGCRYGSCTYCSSIKCSCSLDITNKICKVIKMGTMGY